LGTQEANFSVSWYAKGVLSLALTPLLGLMRSYSLFFNRLLFTTVLTWVAFLWWESWRHENTRSRAMCLNCY